ncbi:hypothetical protein BpHYR1_028871 [Brachionus plicatilis]|uniref:Uncharacterized protein n=1 Tax=Brachionus plicatilis TaxID=10195 RepID=A0A3M7T761_BRAPC|nr:hypothetical protein BpHYR1_028871 [Brachionus plicatilis]
MTDSLGQNKILRDDTLNKERGEFFDIRERRILIYQSINFDEIQCCQNLTLFTKFTISLKTDHFY